MSDQYNRIAASNVGRAVPCGRCGQTHIIERPYADRTTAERLHLYITCRGERYFIGQMHDQPVPPENTND